MSETANATPQAELNPADFPSIPKEEIQNQNQVINEFRSEKGLPPMTAAVPPAKTEAEIAAEKQAALAAERKAAKEKADAEFKAIVDKYTALEGKHFVKNGGNQNQRVEVKKYRGVHTISGGIRAHLLEVEIKGIAAWTPVASIFLSEYTEVETPVETATSKII